MQYTLNIHTIIETALQSKASDIILKAGAVPAFRLDGKIIQTLLAKLTSTMTRELAFEILCACSRDRMLVGHEDSEDTESLMKRLDRLEELDVVFTVPNRVRVRANLFLEGGSIGITLRVLRLHPATLEELHLPLVLKKQALEPHGLIIITGPTGSGKTTTMAALIEEINLNKNANIFTIEDPVEYLFEDKRSVIHQREVGRDTHSFATALRSVTRQTPDVIAIGELRDRETMEVALSASEIGHLVITTLHTTTAANTLDRIVHSFPDHLANKICQQISASLLCITSQRLLPHASGVGRIPAVEVLINSPTIRKHLEQGETHDLPGLMRDGAHFGMNTLNQALATLCEKQAVQESVALQFTSNPSELKQILRQQ
jgi:twitching motility protein PilT